MRGYAVRVTVVDRRTLLASALAASVREALRLPPSQVFTSPSISPLSSDPGDVVVVVTDGVPLSRLPRAVDDLLGQGVRILLLVDPAARTSVRRCLEAHASVLSTSSDPDELRKALRAVIAGEHFVDSEFAASVDGADIGGVPELSPQEVRVLVLYAGGTKLDTVARRIGVSPTTAREYIERVKRKYAAVGRPVHTKHELRTVVLDHGWATDDMV